MNTQFISPELSEDNYMNFYFFLFDIFIRLYPIFNFGCDYDNRTNFQVFA